MVRYGEVCEKSKGPLPRCRSGDALPDVDIVGEVLSTFQVADQRASEDAASALEPVVP